jgi:hypothetical protein
VKTSCFLKKSMDAKWRLEGGWSWTSQQQRRNQASAVGSVECSDFHLFGPHLDGKRYARDSYVKRNVISRPHTIDTQFSHARIQTLRPRLDKCSNIKGMYHLLSVYHAQTEVRLKFSVSMFMLPYFSNFPVRISETSPTRHIHADGNLYGHHCEN